SSRRRHTRFSRDWSSDVCSSDLDHADPVALLEQPSGQRLVVDAGGLHDDPGLGPGMLFQPLAKLGKTVEVVGQLATGAVLAVGLEGGDIEGVVGNVDAHDGKHAELPK